MKALLFSLLLAISASTIAENVNIHDLFGCDTLDAQKLKLSFLRTALYCSTNECSPGTQDLSIRNYAYIQNNHCHRIENGVYKIIRQAAVPGGRVVQVKSHGELLWVLD